LINNLEGVGVANGNWHLNSYCNRVNGNKEDFLIIEGNDVAVYSSNTDFTANPTYLTDFTIQPNPPATGEREKRGTCTAYENQVYFGLSTVQFYDGTRVTQLTLPSPYNIPSASIQFSFIILTRLEFLIIGSPSLDVMIVKHPTINDKVVSLGARPSSITALYQDNFLVTYNSTTLNQRHMYNSSLITTENSLTVHTKVQTWSRDIASTYIDIPIQDFNTPIYFVLFGENIIEKVNALTGSSINFNTIIEWVSTDVNKIGFVKNVGYSNFVVAAREDEDQICLVNHITTGSGNRCLNTGTTRISMMSVSQKYRYVYVSDNA
jgi:hypothetical protein